jgi:hypothetical protein
MRFVPHFYAEKMSGFFIVENPDNPESPNFHLSSNFFEERIIQVFSESLHYQREVSPSTPLIGYSAPTKLGDPNFELFRANAVTNWR